MIQKNRDVLVDQVVELNQRDLQIGGPTDVAGRARVRCVGGNHLAEPAYPVELPRAFKVELKPDPELGPERFQGVVDFGVSGTCDAPVRDVFGLSARQVFYEGVEVPRAFLVRQLSAGAQARQGVVDFLVGEIAGLRQFFGRLRRTAAVGASRQVPGRIGDVAGSALAERSPTPWLAAATSGVWPSIHRSAERPMPAAAPARAALPGRPVLVHQRPPPPPAFRLAHAEATLYSGRKPVAAVVWTVPEKFAKPATWLPAPYSRSKCVP